MTRSVGLQTLLIAAGGWMALGLLVLYQTYAHGDEEEASQSGQSSSKPEQGCDLQVDRTPSLTSSLGRPPSGAPTHDTSPRKGDDEASLAGKRPLSPRRGIPEDPRGSDELDEIISIAAARYDAQMGPGSSSPILASLELSADDLLDLNPAEVWGVADDDAERIARAIAHGSASSPYTLRILM